jgi:hypothetical protein
LAGVAFDAARCKALSIAIAADVKARMMEIRPRGYKHVVVVQISEARGQGARCAASNAGWQGIVELDDAHSSHMACVWDAESDVVAREVFENVRAARALLACRGA